MARSSEITVDDFDDRELNLSLIGKANLQTENIPSGMSISNSDVKELKKLMFGTTNGCFNEEWKMQSLCFTENPNILYGLVQKKGGPCGVLACLQAYIVRELVFPESHTTGLKALDKRKQDWALNKAICEILWKAGQAESAIVALPSKRQSLVFDAGLRSDGITETLTLTLCSTRNELKECVTNCLSAFKQQANYGCIALLYSAVLSRGIENVRSDMDEKNGKLIGAHGYCTQEIVNLLLTGKAVSNVFDGVIELDSGSDEKSVLRGISSRSQIGLLSLFEHYNSCLVGKNLKNPVFPIWVVCSESHFTVLFASSQLVDKNEEETKKFELIYYDGLARQDKEIILYIDISNEDISLSTTDLTPPLEHCVRTRWPNALIQWHGSEPLL